MTEDQLQLLKIQQEMNQKHQTSEFTDKTIDETITLLFKYEKVRNI